MSASASEPTYLEQSLGSFIELVSAAEPAPAGGSVAAAAISLAAGLCVMAARLSSKQIADAPDLALTAEDLRDRAAALCQADAEAYSLVVRATRRPSEPDPERRRLEISSALSAATEVPMQLVEIAARVSALAARIAEDGNPNLLGDAVTAALLAEAGGRAAAALVRINLEGLGTDTRRSRAALLLDEARESTERAWSRIRS